jgi:REP element-mobilizing transposase RayT
MTERAAWPGAPADPGRPVTAKGRWTNSYFVATCGGPTLEVIKRYVENQRKA